MIAAASILPNTPPTWFNLASLSPFAPGFFIRIQQSELSLHTMQDRK